MTRTRISYRDLLLLATAIGLIATFSAPWLELRGTFQAWRIVEWHTFWGGQGAFKLSEVAAANFRVPIEFATSGMRDTVNLTSTAGKILAIWHTAMFGLIVTAGGIMRIRRGVGAKQVTGGLTVIALITAIVLYGLALAFALPSSLSPKVDFRTPTDIHTDSLVWSSVTVFPVAPALSFFALVVQSIALVGLLRHSGGRRSADGRHSL